MSQILIFSPTPSHPQSAGNRIRIYNLAKHLQKLGNTIHFVYFTQEGLTEEQEQEMSKQWDSLTIIKKEKPYTVLTHAHYLIDDWYQEDIGPIIQEKCEELNIDIVLVNYIFQSKLLDFVPNNIVKIIDTHDRFSDRHIMLQKNGIEADFFYTIKEEESKAFNRADIILAIQGIEADFFRTLTDKRVEAIGHLEENRFLNKEYHSLQKIGFIGSQNSSNISSLSQFIEKFIRWTDEYDSNIKLLIAGSVCTKLKTEHTSIELLGFVDNLDNFYSKVDMIINPLTFGTGLKIKSIEALSYGVPTISTEVGFEGISSKSHFHHLKDLDQMIDLIGILYKEPKILTDLAQKSKQLFESIESKAGHTLEKVVVPKSSWPSLLFVTHINFWELDLGSRMRLYHMLNYIKAFFSIRIVYTEKRKKDDFSKLKKLGYHKQVVFLDELDGSEINRSKIEALLHKHSVLSEFYNESLYTKMQTYVNEHHFDSVIVEYIHFSYFLPLFENKKCFLDSIDIMNIRNDLFRKNHQKHWIDISEEEEFAIFGMYHRILSIQKSEYAYLIKNNIASLLVPYSFPYRQADYKNVFQNIVFIGGNNQANAEAINWFITKVWPLFVHSELQLKICGSVSNSIQGDREELRAKNISVLGRVDDLDDLYINGTDLMINPVHIGGGIKIKNVEALANGLPLITTTEGSNGLEDGANDAFILANDVDEWQDAIIALILSDVLRKKLSNNAADYAKKYFSEKVCYNELVHILMPKEENQNGDS